MGNFSYNGRPEVEEVRRTSYEEVTSVTLVLGWDGVRRYRARFTKNLKRSGQHVRISNKEFFNDRGILEDTRARIPDNIYYKMQKVAMAIIHESRRPTEAATDMNL